MAERYVVRTDQTAAQRIGPEAVIINFETYYYYDLNRTGTAVWDLLLEGGRDRDELSGALAAAFKTPVETVSRDVDALVDQLLAEGLIATSPAAAGTPAVVHLTGAYVAPLLEKHEKLDQLILSGE
jgi:erythromycin esterase-like protein